MPGPWERIVVNFEVDYEEGPVSGAIFFPVVRTPAGEFAVNNDLRLPSTVKAMFLELNDASFATGGSHWGICDLIIEGDGTYSFNFDYGPPKRLNGIHDEASYDRFKNYLATYKAELAAAE